MIHLIIFGAEYLYLVIIAIAVIYFFTQPRLRQKNIAIFCLFALPLIYIGLKISASLYFNPRPFVVGHFVPLVAHASDNGFPSDHALLTSAISSVIFFFNKKISAGLWLLTILVGISRVMAGLHHSIDIVGAVAISIIASVMVDYGLIHSKVIDYKNNPS
jgi:undecaprenyl-diphosphatase